MKIFKIFAVLVTIAFLAVLWGRYDPVLDTSAASSNASPIDLSRYVNAQLTESLNCEPEGKGNDLGSLPTGAQRLANAPFDVQGIVEVSGLQNQAWRRMYPVEIPGITINKKCKRLFLLHGAGGGGDPVGTVIAKLVLHYDDKSTRTLKIKIGDHVRDWWGDPKEPMLNKGSELAWTGSNATIKKISPGQRLRLYRSIFANPKPKRTITGIDYISTQNRCSSFLIGLTVD